MSRPYLSVQELVTMELGIDWTSIPRKGADAQAQQAAQTQLCLRASSRMDEIAGQNLQATVDTEELQGPDFLLTVDGSTGEGRFVTSRWPVLQIISGQWASAAAYSQTGPPFAAIQPWQMRTEGTLIGELGSLAPGASAAGPNAIRIAPGIIDTSFGRKGFRVQITYVNGWPNATVQPSVARPNGPAATDTSIHVDDITGWAGVAGTVYDGAEAEQLSVTSVTPDTVGANAGPGLIVLASALTYSHAPGTRVSAMPASLQWAAGLLCTAMALNRGASAIAAQSVRGQQMASGRSIEDLNVEAETILVPYSRIW